jgi:2-oxoisovalerate dehydrogenase E2 component (dihydrolipoyl transacylase)
VLAEDVRVPIRGVKRLMVKSMQAAQQVQHLTLMEEVNMDSLVRVRSELKVVAEKRGLKLSYLPFVIKAASLALTQFPMLNSTVNADVTEVVYHANHNIGVAMDTPNGLVVPVLRAVQNKSIFEISQELTALQEKAVTGKLTEKDFQGGTFSLSNIGSIAGTYATPVLVVPQVMIGAIGRMQVLPRYVGKNGKPATPADVENGTTTAVASTVMNISWSADHRVVDGASVARFSNVWKGYIEQPNTMMGALR